MSQFEDFTKPPPVKPEVHYEHSEELSELAPALAALQAKCGGCAKSGVNPQFKSAYSTLGDVWAVVRPAQAGLGLALVQIPVARGDKAGVVTHVMHSSGQWLKATLLLPSAGRGGFTAQAVGSAVTYAKRYVLTGICGVADDDDDGNMASAQPEPKPRGRAGGKVRGEGLDPPRNYPPKQQGPTLEQQARKALNDLCRAWPEEEPKCRLRVGEVAENPPNGEGWGHLGDWARRRLEELNRASAAAKKVAAQGPVGVEGRTFEVPE
jgi:hypothetical protein